MNPIEQIRHKIGKENLVESRVTYMLELEDRFIIIENVPARVNIETGEKYFSPETVEKLQDIIWSEREPVRVIETPVYEFAA